MKTMWKKAVRIVCVVGLSVLCLAGCGKDIAGSQGSKQQDNVADEVQTDYHASEGTQENNHVSDDVESGNTDNGEFYDGADLEGSVVEFSDEGFSLSPATTDTESGGGQVMVQAAPGAESDDNNVQISYADNTVFQIVNLSTSSQKEISREDTDKESIKKQSQVCVFGSCQDATHWTADKILILRWQ